MQTTQFLGLSLPAKGAKHWDVFLNNNFTSLDQELSKNSTEHAQYVAENTRINKRIDGIVAQAGTDNTEVVDARTSNANGNVYPTLGGRLDNLESNLVDLNQRCLNIDEYGNYTKIEYRDKNNVLVMDSVVSEQDNNGNYLKMTVTRYVSSGVTEVTNWRLTYDKYNKLISREMI